MNRLSHHLFLFVFCFISLIACSEDSDSEAPEMEAQQLIVGEWDFISEHSYYCTNDEIATERPADGVVNTFTFNADGTYEENEDGTLSNKGEWTLNENGTYQIVETENRYDDVLGNYELTVEFDGQDIMKWDVYGCQNDSDTYVYARYDRRN